LGCEGVGDFFDGLRFSSEDSFERAEIHGFENAGIGRDSVAGF